MSEPFEIKFTHLKPCCLCEENGENVTPTIYVDVANGKESVGGYMCREHFEEAIKDYLKYQNKDY